LSVKQADGDLLLIEQKLHLVQPCSFCRRLLLFRSGPLLEQGTPLRVALPVFLKFVPLPLEDVLCLA
jgi:hypothetical protein